MAACGAKTRSGSTCKNAGMSNGRCRMHGGKTPTGAALPQFRHGRYSKYLPQGLEERYRAGRTDPEVLTLRDEIALVDTRISVVLGRLDTGDEAASWQELRRLIDQRLRLVKSERRRLVELGQFLPAGEAMALVTAISDSITRHVRDPQALAGISADVSRLTAIEHSR